MANCKECPIGHCGEHCNIDFETGSCKFSRMSHYEILEERYKRLEADFRHYKSVLGGQIKGIFESAAKYGYQHGVGGNLLDNMYDEWLKKEGKGFIDVIEEANKK